MDRHPLVRSARVATRTAPSGKPQWRYQRATCALRAAPNTNPTGHSRSSPSQGYRTLYDVDDEVSRLETRLAELKAIQHAAKNSQTERKAAPTANVNTTEQAQPGQSAVEQPKLSDKGKQRTGSPSKPVPQVEDEQKSEPAETMTDIVGSHVISETASDITSDVAYVE